MTTEQKQRITAMRQNSCGYMTIAKAVGLSLVLSFLVTIFPARRAARMNPVEALRHE